MSSGSHYNPFQKNHGAPVDTERHVGDLGNIERFLSSLSLLIVSVLTSLYLFSDKNGIAKIDLTDSFISLNGALSIVG